MKRYRIKKVPSWASSVSEGDTVYLYTGYDYGLARDDTAYFGKEHVCVTVQPDGKGFCFTCPLEDLEEIKE